MTIDHDAAWLKLQRESSAARVSFDAAALEMFIKDVRDEAQTSMTVSTVEELIESLDTGSKTGQDLDEPGWWTRHWRQVLAGTAALTLVGGLTAAGIATNARTGWFGVLGSENGTSEMIDQRGDNYVQLAKDSEPSDMAYPAGLTSTDAADFVLSQFPAGAPGNLPEDALRSAYCHYANIMWLLMWEHELETGDSAGQETALQQIDNAVNCAERLHVWGDDLYEVLMAEQNAARAGDLAPLQMRIEVSASSETRRILAQALETSQ